LPLAVKWNHIEAPMSAGPAARNGHRHRSFRRSGSGTLSEMPLELLESSISTQSRSRPSI
jgi:hypothetical protein